VGGYLWASFGDGLLVDWLIYGVIFCPKQQTTSRCIVATPLQPPYLHSTAYARNHPTTIATPYSSYHPDLPPPPTPGQANKGLPLPRCSSSPRYRLLTPIENCLNRTLANYKSFTPHAGGLILSKTFLHAFRFSYIQQDWNKKTAIFSFPRLPTIIEPLP